MMVVMMIMMVVVMMIVMMMVMMTMKDVAVLQLMTKETSMGDEVDSELQDQV